jgi:hypothetical protein
MNAAKGRLNALTVGTHCSQQHLYVYELSDGNVWVVSSMKVTTDFLQEVNVERGRYMPSIKHFYGIINSPDGAYRERTYWSLDRFCELFNIKHVNDLNWVYAGEYTMCHNTDPRDIEHHYYPADKVGEYRSALQHSIDRNNYDYDKKHAWWRAEGDCYAQIIGESHPEFKQAYQKMLDNRKRGY